MQSDTFLTDDELHELTGRSRHGAQIKQLEHQGFQKGLHFWVNAAGVPRVSRQAVSMGKAQPPAIPAWQPSL